MAHRDRSATRLLLGLTLVLGALAFEPSSAGAQADETGGALGTPEIGSTRLRTSRPPARDPAGEPEPESAESPTESVPEAYQQSETVYPPSPAEAARAEAPEPTRRGYITPSTATRLRVLNSDLQALAARSNSGVLDGILGIIGGGLGITLGILADDGFISTYFYIWGGAGIARAIIDLSLSPNIGDRAVTFGHMPMRNPREVEERLVYGETALEYIAFRTRLARLLDGSINVAAGAAALPLYLSSDNLDTGDPFFYFVIIGSSLSVIGGIVTLATRSDAEKRWSAYQELRDNLTRSEHGGIEWDFHAGPIRGGGMGVLQGRF